MGETIRHYIQPSIGLGSRSESRGSEKVWGWKWPLNRPRPLRATTERFSTRHANIAQRGGQPEPRDGLSGIDWSKWLGVGVAATALFISATQFYMSSLKEIHDFRAIYGDTTGIFLVNAGNRTEILESAQFREDIKFSHGKSSTNNGDDAGPAILKPGEATFIKMSLPIETLEDQKERHNFTYFLQISIIDTRHNLPPYHTTFFVNLEMMSGASGGDGPSDSTIGGLQSADLYKVGVTQERESLGSSNDALTSVTPRQPDDNYTAPQQPSYPRPARQ